MWKCNKCGEELEDTFDSCWKCAKPDTKSSNHQQSSHGSPTKRHGNENIIENIKQRWSGLDTEELSKREKSNELNDVELAAVRELLSERGIDRNAITSPPTKQPATDQRSGWQEESAVGNGGAKPDVSKVLNVFSKGGIFGGTGAGSGYLCPFSWIEVTKPAGCLSGLFGGKDKLVTEPQSCMESRCKLWDSAAGDCGLITKK